MDKAYLRKIKTGFDELFIKRAWPIYVIPIVIYATLVIPYLIKLWNSEYWTPVLHLRISGFFLQLIFVYIVVRSIFNLRKEFKLPGPIEVVKKWFNDFIELFSTIHRKISLSDSYNIQDLISVKKKPSLGQAHKELIERIEILEERLLIFENETHEEIQDIKLRLNKLQEIIKAEKTIREQDLKEVRHFIKYISTTGFKCELVGLFWLVIGLLLSIFPGELTFLLSLIW